MTMLTIEARKKLASKQIAMPEKRSYPIPDVTHAHNALSRVSQFGSAEEQAQVRGAVHRKYPEIGAQPRAAVLHKTGQKDKHKSIGHRIVGSQSRSERY